MHLTIYDDDRNIESTGDLSVCMLVAGHVSVTSNHLTTADNISIYYLLLVETARFTTEDRRRPEKLPGDLTDCQQLSCDKLPHSSVGSH